MLTVMQLWWSFCRTRSEEGIVQVHDAILERSATFCGFLAMQHRNNILYSQHTLCIGKSSVDRNSMLCTIHTPCALAGRRTTEHKSPTPSHQAEPMGTCKEAAYSHHQDAVLGDATQRNAFASGGPYRGSGSRPKREV